MATSDTTTTSSNFTPAHFCAIRENSVRRIFMDMNSRTILRGFLRFLRIRHKSTGDLMKDCKWDKLVKEANCVDEAPMKNPQVEMKLSLESTEGQSGPFIEVEEKNLCVLDPTPPDVLESSLAIIRRRPKIVTQQGTNNVGGWELQFGTRERWENPLMGWSSSGYPLSNTTICFNSVTEAEEFATRRGWNYQIEDSDKQTKLKKPLKKWYGEIYDWSRRTRASTK